MSLQDFPLRYVARVHFEFTTPFHVGAGREGETADAEIVRDANDLPTIPGSSLAGALRSEFLARAGEISTKALFGFQGRAKGSEPAESQGSRLSVSWACLHDSNGMPVEGLVAPERLNDQVLASALLPTLRDHVCINHRGTADAKNRGKFDEMAVCAGHRFTFEMELVGKEQDQASWKLLLGILANPATRLGGKTRRGFGAFKVVQIRSGVFNLKDEDDFENYATLSSRLAGKAPVLKETIIDAVESAATTLTVELALKPCGYWMFGGGSDLPQDAGDADFAPVRDRIVCWENDRGSVVDDVLVVPATAVKGAIAHRVAFHYNALNGHFADGKGPDELKALVGSNNPAVSALFGCVKDSNGNDDKGHRGRVVIDDLFIHDKVPQQLVHHVSIDRFAGGARAGALFSERPLWRGWAWDFCLTLRECDKIKDDNVKKSLDLTLRDLAESRLQLGAGSGRGLGFFKSEKAAKWSDDGAWLESKQ